jgi:hypothetical protein
MKKQLLLMGAFALVCSAMFAQNKSRVRMATSSDGIQKTKKVENIASEPKSTNVNVASNGTEMPLGQKFASSQNAFTSLVSESSCLSATTSINTAGGIGNGIIAFTCRKSSLWSIDGGGTGNFAYTKWTKNYGLTWDSMVVITPAAVGVNVRYPSGAILNPTGNTADSNVVMLASAPLVGSPSWVGNAYTSSRLRSAAGAPTMPSAGGNNLSQLVEQGAAVTEKDAFPRQSWYASSDNKGRVLADLYDGNGYGDGVTITRGMRLITGTYNPTTKSTAWSKDSFSINSAPSDPKRLNLEIVAPGTPEFSGAGLTAWSSNGQVGYVVTTGVEEAYDSAVVATTELYGTYMPIVYKTTNGGTTWARYAQNFDWTFDTLGNNPNPGIKQLFDSAANKILPNGSSKWMPFLWTSEGYGAVVDANNNLNIMCYIKSNARITASLLGRAYLASGSIFNLRTTASGSWEAVYVDDLVTELASGATTGRCVTSNPWIDVTLSARIQASVSPDGNKVSAIWVDAVDTTGLATDSIAGVNIPCNITPDIKGASINVATNLKTEPKFFTPFSVGSDDFWIYVSKNSVQTASDTVRVPVVSATGAAIIAGGASTYNSGARIDHYFYRDAYFANSEYTKPALILGIDKNTAVAKNLVSVYPNPTKSEVNLRVSTSAKNVTFEMVNVLGQKVFASKGIAGNNRFNVSNLQSGAYFANVTVDGVKSTQKIIIE